jgi:hypothetical protein
MEREWMQVVSVEYDEQEWLELVTTWYRDQAERFSIDLAGAY